MYFTNEIQPNKQLYLAILTKGKGKFISHL